MLLAGEETWPGTDSEHEPEILLRFSEEPRGKQLDEHFLPLCRGLCGQE